ncbi:RagB/SusD family nutrient uptake outer membrane protein [Ulvibacterium sp.]|uniref:RagB/SusD family nutrient uptake outer membrane protein n=1 Tax=Ulvibacterium sp. TaxID=2665914 RepID=UPI003BA9100B
MVLEFWFERVQKANRFGTYKLEGVIDDFNQDNPQHLKEYEPHEYIWPIPQVEINLNPGAVQNPG